MCVCVCVCVYKSFVAFGSCGEMGNGDPRASCVAVCCVAPFWVILFLPSFCFVCLTSWIRSL